MMKYLSSLLCFVVIASAASANELTALFETDNVDITSVEFYQDGMSSWSAAADLGPVSIFTERFRYSGSDVGSNFGPLYMRVNGDDSLVFVWSPPAEWPALGTRYEPRLQFSVAATGIVLHVYDVVKDGGSAILFDGVNNTLRPMTTPLQQGDIVMPVDLNPAFMVRVAIYDTWVTQVSRMWIIALPMFGLGMIAFIYAASKKWGGKIAGA